MGQVTKGVYEQSRPHCLECGRKFRKLHSFDRVELCWDCKRKEMPNIVVYDREKGVGSIPPNLIPVLERYREIDTKPRIRSLENAEKARSNFMKTIWKDSLN